MKKRMCEEISEKLVAYADDELSADEAAEVSEHIADCQDCRNTVKALGKSLAIAQVIWQDSEAELAEIQLPKSAKLRKRPYLRIAGIAAGFILVIIGTFVWQLRPKPQTKVSEEITIAEIKHAVQRAGEAAQLLTAADLLAREPGGIEYARKQYQYVAESYPDLESGVQAKFRIQTIFERSVQ